MRQDEFSALEPSTLSVARIAADVLAESSLGVMVTSGDPFSNQSSSLVGADFHFLNSRLPGDRTLEGDAWFQKSSNPGLDGDDTAFGLGGQLVDTGGWEFGGKVTGLERTSSRPWDS